MRVKETDKCKNAFIHGKHYTVTVVGKKTLCMLVLVCARAKGLLTMQETCKEGGGRENGIADKGCDTMVGLTFCLLKTMM